MIYKIKKLMILEELKYLSLYLNIFYLYLYRAYIIVLEIILNFALKFCKIDLHKLKVIILSVSECFAIVTASEALNIDSSFTSDSRRKH